MTLWSVLVDDVSRCAITGSTNVAIHHVFFGRTGNREKSEKYGFLLPLRPDWHNGANYGIHFDHQLDLYWKKKAQEYFESHYGSREKFLEEFGKSYL